MKYYEKLIELGCFSRRDLCLLTSSFWSLSKELDEK